MYGWSVFFSQVLNPDFHHYYIVFTLPGKLNNLLLNRSFKPSVLNILAAGIYRKKLRAVNYLEGNEWQPVMVSTVHVAGNGLNYNPHVHMIATRELVNKKTGEFKETAFLSYKEMRFEWQQAVLYYLSKKNILTNEEKENFLKKYKNGFDVHFKPIARSGDDVLYKTAQYIGTNIFHNSQIRRLNHEQKVIEFSYKAWVSKAGEKSMRILKIPVYDFMARILFFLPDKHEKTVRYYGIYFRPAKKAQPFADACWADAVKATFETDSERCPECQNEMHRYIIFSRFALRRFAFAVVKKQTSKYALETRAHTRGFEKQLRENSILLNGYFYPKLHRG